MNVEQRAAIKFCVKNGFSRIQIIEYREYCSEKKRRRHPGARQITLRELAARTD